MFQLNYKSKYYWYRKTFILFLLKLVIFLDLSVRGHQGGDLDLSVFAHSLQSCVFSDGIIDLHCHFMDLHLQVVYLAPHLGNVLFIDINLDFMFVLGTFLLIEKQGVLWFDVGHFIIQSKEIVFQIFQLEKLLLKRSDDSVFVGWFYLVKVEVWWEISLHRLVFYFVCKKKINL